MRKKQLRKFPFRNRIYNDLRKMENSTITIVDEAGHEIVLNIAKHILFNRPYKNLEYQRELIRRLDQYRR